MMRLGHFTQQRCEWTAVMVQMYHGRFFVPAREICRANIFLSDRM